MRIFCCWLLMLVTACASAESLRLQGDFIPGATIIGRVEIGVVQKAHLRNEQTEHMNASAALILPKVYVDGKELRVTANGEFIFGLGRNASGAVELKVVEPNGRETLNSYTIGTREYQIQKIEGVKSKHVTPAKEVLDRIAAEGRKVSAARSSDSVSTYFLEPFIWPLVGPITGVYGSQRFYNGQPRSPHYGLDIAAPQGTDVIAPATGVVRLAEPDLYYSGGTLIIDHGHGFTSTFIHLHKVLVKVGQEVKQGDTVAQVGATGRATGPHLDWRLNWFSVRLDPALFMRNIPIPIQK